MIKENSKVPTIEVYEIKTFRQLSHLKKKVDSLFNGRMPINIYNKFLRAITNPLLKTYFINEFKPKLQIQKSQKSINKIHKPKLYKPKSPSTLKYKPSQDFINNIKNKIITVKATDFSFKHVLSVPHLVFGNYSIICYLESKWFQPQVLKSINRTFKIRINDYTGFSFIPASDKQLFLDMLRQAYVNNKKQLYSNELDNCFKSINWYLDRCVNKYINKYHHIRIDTTVEEYNYDDDKQIYIYKTNILAHLDMITEHNIRIHIPLSQILKQFKNTYEEYFKEITAKYPDGYYRYVTIDDFFPNFTSADISIAIPEIFVTRLDDNQPIVIKADYSTLTGRFSSRLSTYVSGRTCKTETSAITFNTSTRNSLINIMRKIDSRFIITFYTAYLYMFNRVDKKIQKVYDTQLELNSRTKSGHEYMGRYFIPLSERYKSAHSQLRPFDRNNSSDWLWLTAQMQNNVFIQAYSFIDKDNTLSSLNSLTIHHPKKVYLTVKDESDIYSENKKETYRSNVNSVEKVIISMYALDTSKSIYRFKVYKSKLNEAIFFIWSYFSSNNYNKRQDFGQILVHKKDFGIIKFYKDSPLQYRFGIGYFEKEWLIDY